MRDKTKHKGRYRKSSLHSKKKRGNEQDKEKTLKKMKKMKKNRTQRNKVITKTGKKKVYQKEGKTGKTGKTGKKTGKKKRYVSPDNKDVHKTFIRRTNKKSRNKFVKEKKTGGNRDKNTNINHFKMIGGATNTSHKPIHIPQLEALMKLILGEGGDDEVVEVVYDEGYDIHFPLHRMTEHNEEVKQIRWLYKNNIIPKIHVVNNDGGESMIHFSYIGFIGFDNLESRDISRFLFDPNEDPNFHTTLFNPYKTQGNADAAAQKMKGNVVAAKDAAAASVTAAAAASAVALTDVEKRVIEAAQNKAREAAIFKFGKIFSNFQDTMFGNICDIFNESEKLPDAMSVIDLGGHFFIFQILIYLFSNFYNAISIILRESSDEQSELEKYAGDFLEASKLFIKAVMNRQVIESPEHLKMKAFGTDKNSFTKEMFCNKFTEQGFIDRIIYTDYFAELGLGVQFDIDPKGELILKSADDREKVDIIYPSNSNVTFRFDFKDSTIKVTRINKSETLKNIIEEIKQFNYESPPNFTHAYQQGTLTTGKKNKTTYKITGITFNDDDFVINTTGKKQSAIIAYNTITTIEYNKTTGSLRLVVTSKGKVSKNTTTYTIRFLYNDNENENAYPHTLYNLLLSFIKIKQTVDVDDNKSLFEGTKRGINEVMVNDETDFYLDGEHAIFELNTLLDINEIANKHTYKTTTGEPFTINVSFI